MVGQVSIGERPNRITKYVIVQDFVFVVQLLNFSGGEM